MYAASPKSFIEKLYLTEDLMTSIIRISFPINNIVTSWLKA
jgi:hypothetical protein